MATGRGSSRRFAFWVIVALLAASVGPAFAVDSVSDLYRGAREQAMGGAYVATVDDAEGIFLNPASMAGVQKITLTYMNLDVEGSSDIYSESSKLSTFNNFNASSVNSLMGEDLYGHVSLSPSIMMPNFGIALLVDDQVALNPKNQASPDVQLGYQFTNGVQAAWGYSISPGGRRSSGQSELRFGVGAKMMWRRGGYYDIPLTEIMSANEDTIKDLAGGYGVGFGVDLGTQYIQHVTQRLSLQAGAAYTDIGNMSFSSPQAAPVPENLSLGVGAVYDFSQFKATLAWDYQHITQDLDPQKREHIGLAIDMPFVSIYGGLSETLPTYGASVDLWFFRLTALEYWEELGTIVGQDTERRYELELTFKF